MKEIQQLRQEFELPLCIEKWGWKYHHLGIPSNKKMPNEEYLPHLKFYVSGFSTCPLGVEWMSCLLYTSDAAYDLLCVDHGARRIINKTNKIELVFSYVLLPNTCMPFDSFFLPCH